MDLHIKTGNIVHMLAKQEPDNTGTYTSMQSLRAAKRITEKWEYRQNLYGYGAYT